MFDNQFGCRLRALELTPLLTWEVACCCWSAPWRTSPSSSTSYRGSSGTVWTWSSRGGSWWSSWRGRACPWCPPVGCSTPCRTASRGWRRGGLEFPAFWMWQSSAVYLWGNIHHRGLGDEEESKQGDEEPRRPVRASSSPCGASRKFTSWNAAWPSCWAQSCRSRLRLQCESKKTHKEFFNCILLYVWGDLVHLVDKQGSDNPKHQAGNQLHDDPVEPEVDGEHTGLW